MEGDVVIFVDTRTYIGWRKGLNVGDMYAYGLNKRFLDDKSYPHVLKKYLTMFLLAERKIKNKFDNRPIFFEYFLLILHIFSRK